MSSYFYLYLYAYCNCICIYICIFLVFISVLVLDSDSYGTHPVCYDNLFLYFICICICISICVRIVFAFVFVSVFVSVFCLYLYLYQYWTLAHIRLVPSAVTVAQLGARAPANPIPAPATALLGETQIWLWHFWHRHSWRIWGLAHLAVADAFWEARLR